MVTAREAYTALVLLVAAERAVELWISRRNAALAFARGAAEVGRGHYRVMAVFHAAFLVACVAEAWLGGGSFPGALGVAALLGVALAQALRYWAIATLGDRWNTRVIVRPGDGPVTAGPYRWVKHPNYVAVVAEVACLPLVFNGYRTALVFSLGNAAILWVRIRVEERALGPRYAEAFAGTPRFLPRGK